jgi:hypothetical protein
MLYWLTKYFQEIFMARSDYTLKLTRRRNYKLYGAEYHPRGRKMCTTRGFPSILWHPEGSLLRSQELSISTYPEPDQSIKTHSYL